MPAGADFDELLAVLELRQTEENTFFGSHPSKNPIRTFGGQMMAQAFVAGSRTVSPKVPPNALSAHFIAGGDPEKDLRFDVVHLRDERRFANRRVDVSQDGVLLTTVLLSYMSAGPGLEHNIPVPDVPQPHGLPKIDDLLVGYEQTVPLFVEALRPIEWRYTNDPAWVMRDKGERLEHNRVWMTSEGKMP
ncbi:MAG TPA: acyl-CoA thioesterase domain-containing protein, partial [Mycobacterium sp.]|nr:acyl-CoA thioesterase domain-containing protein [Mycobacterium sp.]